MTNNLYLVIDVEATCWQGIPGKMKESEIIEIGAVLYDHDQAAVLTEFQSFVKPIRNPILSEFCISLTSITQEEVDNAPEFPEAMGQLQDRILNHYIPIFASWGEYDREQFERDCAYHHLPYPFGDQHLNVKRRFAEKHNRKPCGMKHALRMLGMDIEGTHHRGIDDARNIVRILRVLLEDKHNGRN